MRTVARQVDFLSGSIPRTVLAVVAPLMVAQLVNLLYSIVDRIFIGHMPGSGALAMTGIGVCLPVISLTSSFAMLYGSSGGSPLFALEKGSGNTDEASRIMGTSTVLAVLTGIALTVVCLLFSGPMLTMFGASPDTLPYASDYLSVYVLGSTFVLVSLTLNSFISAQGYTVAAMRFVAAGAVLNLVLDPVLIYGMGLGVVGAAAGTVVSQAVSASLVLWFVLRRAEVRLIRGHMALERARILRICALGASGFMVMATTSMVQTVCNRTALAFGGDLYVGVLTIMNSIRELFGTPLTGLMTGAAPVIGYNYGKGEWDRVRQAVNSITVFGLGFAILVYAVLMLFPGTFVGLFTSDPGMYAAAMSVLGVFFFGYFTVGLQFAGQCTFFGLARPRETMFFTLFRKVMLVIPLTLALPHMFGLGVDGVFVAEPISNIVSGVLCFAVMRVVLGRDLGSRAAGPDGAV